MASVKRGLSERGFGLLCLAPAILLLLALNLGPLLWLLWLSFTDFRSVANKPPNFVGFDNYVRVLTSVKALEALLVTFKFVAMSLLVQMGLGVGLAALVNRLGSWRPFALTALTFPMFVSPAVIGQFWKHLLEGTGPVNTLLRDIGIAGPSWLGKDTALWSIVIVDSWMWTPFVMLMAAAALAGVPKELQEAAALDRADDWTSFWRVSLPVVAPVLAVAAMLRGLDCLRMFDLTQIMTAGGPGTVTKSIPIHLYEQAFRFNETGRAAAFTILFLIVLNLVTHRLAGAMMGRPLELSATWRLAVGLAGAALAVWLLGWVAALAAAAVAVAWICGKLPVLAKSVLAKAAGALLMTASLLPILYILVTSFKLRADISAHPLQPFAPTLENYSRLFAALPGSTAPFSGQLLTSLLVGLTATLATLVVSTLAAYAFSRLQFRGKADLLFFVLSTRMLPAVAVAIPVFLIFTWVGLVGKPVGLMLLYAAMNVGLAVWIMKAFIDKVPKEFEEAAVMERCTPAQAFFRAVLPALWPAVFTTGLFCFLACWNEYAFALFMSPSLPMTAPPQITSALGTGGTDWGYIAAGSAALIVPALILTVLARKTILTGVSFGSVDSK